MATFTYVPANAITLAWNANSESDLGGYKLYWGTSSGVYPNSVDVHNVTQYTLTGVFLPNTTYFFAVTAYNTFSQESGFSNQVSAAVFGSIVMGQNVATYTHHGTRTYASSGSIVMTATAAHAWHHHPILTGSMVVSGLAPHSFTSGGKFHYTGSGSTVMGLNVADHSRRIVATQSGGSMVTGGTAPKVLNSIRSIFSYTGTGKIFTNATAAHSTTHSKLMTGGATMAGSPVFHFFPAAPIVSYSYTASGRMVTNATANHSRRIIQSASGSAVMTGTAPHSVQIVNLFHSYTGVGGINLVATAAHSTVHVKAASGGTALTGSSVAHFFSATPPLFNYFYISAGGMVTSGASSQLITKSYLPVASGARTGGNANALIRTFGAGSSAVTYAGTGTGGIVMGGDPGMLIVVKTYVPVGGIIMDGTGAVVNPGPELFGNLLKFRVYKRDCEVRVKEFGADTPYIITTPFGGPHHDEPSGAEI